MGDEGVGVRVVEALQKKLKKKGVDFFDAGTALHALIPKFEAYDRLIVVDSVEGGGKPGSVYRFTLDDLEKKKRGETDGFMMSIHEMGVEETLFMARLTQKLPDEIIFIGIQPEKIELSDDISPVLKKNMNDFIRAVELEISR